MHTIEPISTRQQTTSNVFEQVETFGHEQVVFCYDERTGLRSIIAIHNTVLGPALGGTRMWPYKTEGEALHDVLRLSRGMTYKAAISGINLGGGKAVVIGDPSKDKSEALWRRYGKFVNSLHGKYITAEDVGTNTHDMEYIAMETKYVTGVPVYMGGSGDPSPVTAYGTYLGIKASVKAVFGNDSLNGKRVAVQGLGHVGLHLIDYLTRENAIVYVTDIKEQKVKRAVDQYKVTAVAPEIIYDLDVDVFSPCALGAVLNDDTIPRLKCAIVAGAANNQLEDEIKHGLALQERGILYAPDFLINAGGLINVYMELVGYNRERAMGTTEKIYNRTLEIYRMARENKITTHEAAMNLARKRIEEIAALKAMQ